MAYKCSFMDNDVYTAQDVNNMFSCLTSAGVVFSDTGNTLSDLNDAVAAAVSEGVLTDASSCKVKCENGIYKISQGVCFMQDGSAIMFDADGAEIEILSGEKNYIYLERNRPANSIDIVVSAIAGGENTVPLAEVSERGEISDTRKYAHAKVTMSSAEKLKNLSCEFPQCTNSSQTITVDIGTGAFSYIIIWEGRCTYIETSTKRVASTNNLAAISEEMPVRLGIGKYLNSTDEYVHFEKRGQYLDIYITNTTPGATYTLNFAVI